MRGKRLVGTRVELPANLIDEIPERGHQCSSIVSAWITWSNLGLTGSIFQAACFVRPAPNEYMLSAEGERARDNRCRWRMRSVSAFWGVRNCSQACSPARGGGTCAWDRA